MNILMIHEKVPRPDRSGCDVRITRVLQCLKNLGHQVTFLGRMADPESRYASALEALDIEIHIGSSRLDDKAYHQWLDPKEGRLNKILAKDFDLVIVYLWFWNHISVAEDFIPAIRALSPRTKIVVLADDRHGLRAHLSARLTASEVDTILAHDCAFRELQIYKASDAVIAISDAEAAYIRRLIPNGSVYVVPFALALPVLKLNDQERSGLLFLGDCDNQAGKDSIEWFLSRVWPKVQALNDRLSLTVAGNNSASVVGTDQSNVRCLGHVLDPGEIFNTHRLFISPTRFGTGISTKILTAMSYGLPVITTTLGAQSLGDISSFAAVIEQDDILFAKAVSALYDDTSWLITSGVRSREFVAELYSLQRCTDAIAATLADVSTWSGPEHDLAPSMFPYRDPKGLEQALYGLELIDQGKEIEASAQLCYSLYRWRWHQPRRWLYEQVAIAARHCSLVVSRSVPIDMS